MCSGTDKSNQEQLQLVPSNTYIIRRSSRVFQSAFAIPVPMMGPVSWLGCHLTAGIVTLPSLLYANASEAQI